MMRWIKEETPAPAAPGESRRERADWAKLRQALMDHRESAELRGAYTPEKLQALIKNHILDDPELFHVGSFRFVIGPTGITVKPFYLYGAPETDELRRRCEAVADSLVRRSGEGSDYDLALALHDFLARNVVYEDGPDRILHTMAGPLTEKRAVCEGFAKAYKYLLVRAGIEARVLSGYGIDPVTGSKELHAWNLVRLEEKWCHVDVTYDTTIRAGDVLRYDYFGLTDEAIGRDHVPLEAGPPARDAGLSYYGRKGLVMGGRRAFGDHLRARLRQGETDVVVQLPGDAPEEELEAKVTDAAQASL